MATETITGTVAKPGGLGLSADPVREPLENGEARGAKAYAAPAMGGTGWAGGYGGSPPIVTGALGWAEWGGSIQR